MTTWLAPFKTHVVIAVTCFACDPPVVRALFEGDVPTGDRIPEAALPEGWTNLDGRTYCDRHHVTVFHTEANRVGVVIDWPPGGTRP